MSEDVPVHPPDWTKVTKFMVMVFNREDYAALEKMHKAACEKFPSMRIDDVCAAIVTEAIRIYREKQAVGEKPALPGVH